MQKSCRTRTSKPVRTSAALVLVSACGRLTSHTAHCALPPAACCTADGNSEAAVRSAGKLRTEGRKYLVQDGDIMHVKSTLSKK